MRLAFTVPLRLVSITNQRMHWRTRHEDGKRQKGATVLAMLVALSKTNITNHAFYEASRSASRIDVTITRYGPRRLDPDNAYSSVKHVLDAIARHCRFDDGDPRLRLVVEQAKCKRTEMKTGVVIEFVKEGS